MSEDTPEEKWCPGCKQMKRASEFSGDRSSRDGLQDACKECENARAREYRRRILSRPPNIPEYKRCPACGETRLESEFYKNKYSTDGLDTYCKLCASSKAKQARIDGRSRIRNGELLRTYGITNDDYNRMFYEQNGRCAICGEVKEEPLMVDHDHQTGKVRGLLCRGCNSGIGWFGDNTDVMRAAIRYLENDFLTSEEDSRE